VVFTTLLSLPDINEIRSDNLLSTNAIDSYLKLMKNTSLKLQIYNTLNFEYSKFSRDNLLSSPQNVQL
jgi:hypothetical protein